MNRERVIEIIAITVARRTVAGVAVELDTVGRVANKVSLNSEFISRKNDETKYLNAGLQKYKAQFNFFGYGKWTSLLELLT